MTLSSLKDGRTCGFMRLHEFAITEYANFAAYLQAGLQMALTVALDFSASNGQVFNQPEGLWRHKKVPKQGFNAKKRSCIEKAESCWAEAGYETVWTWDEQWGESLHSTKYLIEGSKPEVSSIENLSPARQRSVGALTEAQSLRQKREQESRESKINAYQYAIREVGAILEQYDHSKQFPCFGFSGVPIYMGRELIKKGLRPQEPLHCFPLNGSFESPEIKGVDGILKTYK